MKISNLYLSFNKEICLLKGHVFNKIAYSGTLCVIRNYICSLRDPTQNLIPFKPPSIGISSTVCYKREFTVIPLCSSLDFPPVRFTALSTHFLQDPHQIAVRFVHYFIAEQYTTYTALGLYCVLPRAWTNCILSRSTLFQVLLRLQAHSAKCWTLSSCRAVFSLPSVLKSCKLSSKTCWNKLIN